MMKVLSMETLKSSQSVYLITRRMGEIASMNSFPREKKVGTKKSL